MTTGDLVDALALLPAHQEVLVRSTDGLIRTVVGIEEEDNRTIICAFREEPAAQPVEPLPSES